MARRNPIEHALRRVLEEHGIEATLDVSRPHRVFYFAVNGVKLQYFFPSTPTCPRGQANAVSGLRRLIRQTQMKASESSRTPQD